MEPALRGPVRRLDSVDAKADRVSGRRTKKRCTEVGAGEREGDFSVTRRGICGVDSVFFLRLAAAGPLLLIRRKKKEKKRTAGPVWCSEFALLSFISLVSISTKVCACAFNGGWQVALLDACLTDLYAAAGLV